MSEEKKNGMEQLPPHQPCVAYLYISNLHEWQSTEPPTQEQLADWERSELRIFKLEDGQFYEVASGRGKWAPIFHTSEGGAS